MPYTPRCDGSIRRRAMLHNPTDVGGRNQDGGCRFFCMSLSSIRGYLESLGLLMTRDLVEHRYQNDLVDRITMQRLAISIVRDYSLGNSHLFLGKGLSSEEIVSNACRAMNALAVSWDLVLTFN